ncbi:ComF family protein [Coraliomargarita parva]|uniref:ComF family protein n=1 Tax=Coraliomargarita parva TaxID=3014050 RepID=UPI0022B44E96|nr:ComF family protein [Coraliomargarita parva]
MNGRLKQIFHAAADLVFPRSCVHCSEAIEDSPLQFLCRRCSRELFLAVPPACSTCGYPFFGQLAGPKTCPHCAELAPVFDEGKTLFLAKGPGRSLIHELKYHQGFYVLSDLIRLTEQVPGYLDYFKDACLVPVPLHPAKERERGFNQGERIAHTLAARAGGTTRVESLLERIQFTGTQTRLARNERHRNVKNAFALKPDAVLIPETHYILIDDVFTTGATLNACASVLRQAGARRIKVLTIGHG